MSDPQPHPVRTRKPLFTLLALITAIGTAGLSVALYSSGDGAGFEGFGSMLVASFLMVIGTALVLVFCLVAFVRKEKFLRATLISIAISLVNVLWFLGKNG